MKKMEGGSVFKEGSAILRSDRLGSVDDRRLSLGFQSTQFDAQVSVSDGDIIEPQKRCEECEDRPAAFACDYCCLANLEMPPWNWQGFLGIKNSIQIIPESMLS